jgi:ribosome-associated protein
LARWAIDPYTPLVEAMGSAREIPLQTMLDAVERAARFRFSRSGGRGGQNVNKVSTKVLASVSVGDLDLLTDDDRSRVRAKLAARISADDELAVFADEERSQSRNRDLATMRLAELLCQAVYRPRPRIRTRPPRSSKLRRLESKKARSRQKDDRKRPELD